MSIPSTELQQSLIVQYVKELHLPTLGAQFVRLADEAAKQGQSHLSYLEALLEAEVEERARNAIARRIVDARFPKVKTLEEFEFEKAPVVPAALIRSLAEGGYLKRSEPVILLGETGTGKTHLAIGLAVAACRQRKRVRFTTAAGLINDLIEARDKSELGRITSRWSRYELIVIDEMGYVGIPESAAELLFQVIAGRAERAAVIVTTNRLIAWLRKGEIEAQRIRCEPFDASKFRKALQHIRLLTTKNPEFFVPELISLCAACGVAVVFVPELPKARVSGATRWLSPKKALIQLSLRYKTDDHLWFTFFHEAGHILRHNKKNIFLEGDNSENDEEQEANQFASNILIPPAEFVRFRTGGRHSKALIEEFALSIGIAPGIVVGRLQHEEVLPLSHCNDLKQRFAWANEE